MSWFILAKAHSFAHTPLDFILWQVPTLPIGGAMAALALSQTVDARKAWSISFARSFLTLAIPAVILLTVALVALLDRRIDSKGTWVLQAHAHGTPVFADPDIGVELRMTETWFTRRISLRPDLALGHVQIARDQRWQGDELRFSPGREQGHFHSELEMLFARPKGPSPFTRLDVGLEFPISGSCGIARSTSFAG